MSAALATQAALAVTGVPTTAQTYGSTFTVGTTGGSGTGAVTFAATGVCKVTGATVTMTSGTGICPVTATKASDSNYAAQTSATVTVPAALLPQTLDFAAPPALVGYPVPPIALSATGGASGQPVVFSVVSGPASISGNTLTTTGGGTVVAAANQAGNASYSAAPQVTHSLVATAATLTANIASLSFEKQAVGVTSMAQTVIVINPYNFAIPIASIAANGDFAATSNCPSIPAGDNCSIGVTFTPTVSGSRSGTLTIANSYSETPLTLPLTCIGAVAGIATSPASQVFGS